MPGVIEQEETMTPDAFRGLIRKLAAVSGQELAWAEATSVIHGYLDAYLADPGRVVRRAIETRQPVGSLMAKELAATLRGWFDREPKFSTRGTVSGRLKGQ